MSLKQFFVLLVLISLQTGSLSPVQAHSEISRPQSTQRVDAPRSTITPQPTYDINAVINRILNEMEKAPPADPMVQPLVGAPSPNTQINQFLTAVSEDVNGLWAELFRSGNQAYSGPKFVLWTSSRDIYLGKGPTGQEMYWKVMDGPVYSNKQIFIHVSYLTQRAIQIGDFALAVIVAHEYGHHVQNQLGISSNIYNARVEARKINRIDISNNLSIRLELQADCLAGIWAYSTYARNMMDPGDFEEAMQILFEIGDDTLGVANDNHTHGTAKDREKWFMAGYLSGDPSYCETFSDFDSKAQTMRIPSPPQIRSWPRPTPTSQASPVPTQRSTQANPVPTQPSASSPLTNFWIYASNASCKVIEDGVADTSETRRCQAQNGKIIVDYDYWITEKSILNYVNELRENGSLILDDTWSSKDSPYRGEVVSWVAQNGTTILMWTVSAHRVTGTAYGNDLQTLLDWFAKEGSWHYTK